MGVRRHHKFLAMVRGLYCMYNSSIVDEGALVKTNPLQRYGMIAPIGDHLTNSTHLLHLDKNSIDLKTTVFTL